MHITTHAQTNAIARARAPAETLSEYIETGRYHSLGSTVYNKRRYHYLLLYLPMQSRYCIAVVSEHFSTLVTVWSANYNLPANLEKVNRRTKQKARDVHLQHMYSWSTKR